MLRHDERTRGQLVATLDAYFASGGSVAAAARRLPVHVNTMHLRLARIGELLGADWRERDRAVELNLALRLHRLAAELGP
ncbi:MAG: helix-turn-helix domain-containing protein [Thermoleophilia bacterium]